MCTGWPQYAIEFWDIFLCKLPIWFNLLFYPQIKFPDSVTHLTTEILRKISFNYYYFYILLHLKQAFGSFQKAWNIEGYSYTCTHTHTRTHTYTHTYLLVKRSEGWKETYCLILIKLGSVVFTIKGKRTCEF